MIVSLPEDLTTQQFKSNCNNNNNNKIKILYLSIYKFPVELFRRDNLIHHFSSSTRNKGGWGCIYFQC